MESDRTRADPPDPGGDSGERRKADLLWSYLDRLNAGETVDAGAIEREHPEHA
jgi:hypothetical protein